MRNPLGASRAPACRCSPTRAPQITRPGGSVIHHEVHRGWSLSPHLHHYHKPQSTRALLASCSEVQAASFALYGSHWLLPTGPKHDLPQKPACNIPKTRADKALPTPKAIPSGPQVAWTSIDSSFAVALRLPPGDRCRGAQWQNAAPPHPPEALPRA